MTETTTSRTDGAPRFALTVTCPSARGQVAALMRFLDERGCYIDEFDVFDDEFTARFFVRCIFHAASTQQLDAASMREEFSNIANRFDMTWKIHEMSVKPKVLIMVSKLDHCLADLLFRWRMDELKMEIVGVVSNHPDLEPVAAANGIPFHHLPLTADTKPQQEAQVLALVERAGADLVVLARYMQVLSAELSVSLAGRAINIHHSFLPGFKGAKPYHQAYARGVKLIGATAHFVTDDLDEGPIIEQVVERVTHAYGPERLLATGRDMECLALARAVKLFIEHRIFSNGNRTVVIQ